MKDALMEFAVARAMILAAVLVVTLVATLRLSTKSAEEPLAVSERGLFLGFDSVYLPPSPMRFDRRDTNGEIDSCMLSHRSMLELASLAEKNVTARVVQTPPSSDDFEYACRKGDVLVFEHFLFKTYRANFLRAQGHIKH